MQGEGRLWAGCVLLLVVALGITACMHWFSAAPAPTLILGPVTIVGTRGEILLSVADIPGGGIASLAVNVLTGITYDPAKAANLSVEGFVGFEVLAQQFVGGVGGFCIAHAVTGLPTGDFAKIVFDVLDPTVDLTDFTFDKPSIAMGNDDNELVNFQIQDAYKYYAK